MNYRALTISRQYGSGGARIASLLAARLGWSLLDEHLVDAVANETGIERAVIERNDECVTDWLHRVNRETLRSLATMTGVPCREEDFFDADCMAKLITEMITNVYVADNCVIVGRGAECILQDRPDVFKVFIYAPEQQRLRTVQLRTNGALDEAELREVDQQRAAYIRTHFRRHWQDPDLYDLMLSSIHGDQITASTILHAMQCKAHARAVPVGDFAAEMRLPQSSAVLNRESGERTLSCID